MNRMSYTKLCTLFFLCTWIFTPLAKSSSRETRATKSSLVQRGSAAPRRRALASKATVNNTAPKAFPRTSGPSSNVGFQAASHISSGVSSGLDTFPYVSVLGDFNHDGVPDVASIVQNSNSAFYLSILLSNGNGTFSTPTLTPVTFNTTDLLVVGDLNNDASTDVALVHSNSVDVFVSNGTGTFTGPTNYATGIANPVAAAFMNVIGDSSLDLVVASGAPDETTNSPVAIVRGNGNGTFGAITTLHYSGTMTYGVLADLDSDGHPDLVSATQVFLGTSGDFQSGVSLPAASNTCSFPFGLAYGSVVVADVNGDSKLDIVTADCSNQTITTYLNSGTGTFSAGTSTWAAYSAATVTIADVNNDGKADAIVGDFYSMDMLVLLGKGDGSFNRATVGYPAGGDLWAPAVVAKFNSTGNPDIFVPSGISGQWASLVHIVGLGDGTFVAPHDYFYSGGAAGTTADSWGIATADLNHDGLPDFVVGNASSDPTVGFTVYLSDISNPNSLKLGTNYGSGGALQFVALADINGDGKLDLVASNIDIGSDLVGNIKVFLGNGDGTFQTTPSTISVVTGTGVGRLVVADFNGDNKPDVAVVDNGIISPVDQTFTVSVWVLVNSSASGSVSFATPVGRPLSGIGGEIAAADLGNGHVDLVITQPQSTGTISILMGDGTGSFVAQPDFDIGSFYPIGVAVAQLNPAGHPDLIVTIDDDAGMGIAVASGNGDGTFGTPVLYPATSNFSGNVTPYPARVRVADLDGDGNLDLVFTNFGDGNVGVLYGTGQWGTGQNPFNAPVEFAVNDSPLDLMLLDVNGDGALDAVLDSAGYSGITTFLNTAANQVSLSSSANPSSAGDLVTITATVAASPLPGETSYSPSGAVTFTDGVTGILGTGSISGGVATFSTSTLSAGTHVITATYSGDTNLIGRTQATLVQTVDAVSSGYSLVASPTSATLHAGQSANFTVTATPTPSYNGTVSFYCGALPAGVTCTFNPSTITLSGTTPISTSLTVTVAPALVAHNSVPAHGGLPLAGMTFGVLGFVGLGMLGRRDRRVYSSIVLLLVLAAILAATGCGGTTSKPTPTPTPIPQVTPVKVMATSSGNGGSQQLDLTLNIQP